jgi:hypothetical protein
VTKNEVHALVIGSIVHIDTDNLAWGRLATDAILDAVFKTTALVTTFERTATVTVPFEDISLCSKRGS